MSHNLRRHAKPKPVSGLGDASFQLHTTQQTPDRHPPSNHDDDQSGFDIKQFLMDQKATQPFHDSALFRSSASAGRGILNTNGQDGGTNQPYPLRSSGSTLLKKKQLPRMDQPPPAAASLGKGTSSMPTLNAAGSLSTNTPPSTKKLPPQEEVTSSSGYRLYAMENMADCSLHASRSHNHTWQTLRTSDLRSECPCKRSDVLDLVACFDAAMSYSGGKDNWEGDRKTALIDRDYMAVQANVVALYRPATDVTKRLLTSIVFEQKWSDIVLGELEGMLLVSFFEQGNLLRNVRIQYATAFYRLETHYTACEAEKKRALDEATQCRAALTQQATAHVTGMASLRQEYETVIAALKDQMEHERAEADRKLFDAKEQIAKMSETMKTLNAIFKQMREDSDKVRAVELKETNEKLERKCSALDDEAKLLRPLVAQNRNFQAALESQAAEMEAASTRLQELVASVEDKDRIIENLLHRQEQLLVKQDMMVDQQRTKGSGGNDAGGAEASHDDGANPPDASHLCTRCQMSLLDDTSGNGGGGNNNYVGVATGGGSCSVGAQPIPLARRRDGKRVQCLAYRILLPNLQGRRPTKDVSWTLGCMRAILYAKQLDDAICFHMGLPIRLRMAEFVYAWFAPVDNPDLPSDQRDAVYAQADEARWSLYYGAKLLSRDSTEAKVFLSFLDEKYGDDELVFGLFCMRVLDCLAGGELDWSPLRHSMSYPLFNDEWAAHFNFTGESIQVPKVVWITLHHASLATAIVLAKATADERDAFDSNMKAMATLSLPPSDRPTRVVSFDGKNDGPMLDAFQWLNLMLQEYREEQAQRRAAIRLMFQTATTNSNSTTQTTSSSTDDLMASGSANAEMDMEQFRAMVVALNSDVTAGTIATFYRASYERGDGHVTYDAFMATAEALHFFTSCMRLPSPNVLATTHVDTSGGGGINAPHARLGSLVAKHFTLYEAECKLNLQTSPPLTQSLAKAALEELRVVLREGRGSSIDGFRALAAYQRLLALQTHDRMVRTEHASSAITSMVAYRLDKELYSAMDCVRIDHSKRSGAEVLLDSIRRKMSVHRLQRAFRARLLRDQGVPLNMRQLMHGGYGNGRTNYRDRRAIRPTKWLVVVIADLVRSKMQADAVPSANPSRIFVEHIYDHMTLHFGSRWEAEKTIHDIFVNTRSLVATHPRILLFSQLCGMGASGEDKIYGSPQAFAFVTMVLHCGHHRFPILHPNAGDSSDYCRHDDALAIIDVFFSSTGSEKKERMVSRLRELERQSPKPKTSDADMLLLLLLEEWRHYMLDRMNQIKVVCCSDSNLMAIEGYLSLDNVIAIFRRTGIDISELEVAQVFRQVVQSNYSSLSLMERLVKFVFPILCHGKRGVF
ncbi:hypothetical protein, variant [Aphanomyces astaci]|uniref:Uncharacterized protein n=1 Tax=Aphanomyces astaci TaxID=112090 RepID=W4FEI3_APHAT|nr:hypothetical protein, variant [Aphanomyces astaci]ETV65299.1 hypothetical protein, variant [Aphanomyces astaci]|eukprot:XP_009845225.1 hypothetical protein, variant [Aphanomyces astaci]